MLQLSTLRSNTEEVINRLKKRKIDASQTIHDILKLDEQRRQAQADLDSVLAESNQISKEIGILFKQGKRDEAEVLKSRTLELKEQSKSLGNEQEQLRHALDNLLVSLPNTPHHSVPEGSNEKDNEELSNHGTVPKFDFTPKPHWELTEKFNIIDFELGVKITGAGFPIYRGKGARLQRALINFFLNENMNAGFEEVQAPYFVNEASGFGTGQLPDKEGQMYHMPVDNLYAIPTAEVPLTNMYRDTIVKAEDLPIKLTGHTPCFRREAGSYGKDVRGLNRLHQFDKVELVVVSKVEDSYTILDEMVSHVSAILDKLGLPYRILRLCGGDMGFTSALTYDFEVYSAAQERWLEVSSVSNFETFQANRLKLRYRDGDSKPKLAHTLNGSSLALPRIMAAIIENYQTEDGIEVPEILRPFTGFNTI